MVDALGRPCGYETLSVPTSVTALTASVISTSLADACLISVEGASIRFVTFGVPSSTVGHLVDPPAGQQAQPPTLSLLGRDSLLGFRAIATSGTATLRVSYFSRSR